MKALKNNNQAEPISVAVTVEMNRKELGQRVRTFSVRSINECLLGYCYGRYENFMIPEYSLLLDVNEENPMIDYLLRVSIGILVL